MTRRRSSRTWTSAMRRNAVRLSCVFFWQWGGPTSPTDAASSPFVGLRLCLLHACWVTHAYRNGAAFDFLPPTASPKTDPPSVTVCGNSAWLCRQSEGGSVFLGSGVSSFVLPPDGPERARPSGAAASRHHVARIARHVVLPSACCTHSFLETAGLPLPRMPSFRGSAPAALSHATARSRPRSQDGSREEALCAL